MDINIAKAFELYMNKELEQVIISNSTESELISKVKIRPVLIKGNLLYQVTEFRGQKVLHQNYSKDELLEKLSTWFEGLFRQVQIISNDATVTILISKKG